MKGLAIVLCGLAAASLYASGQEAKPDATTKDAPPAQEKAAAATPASAPMTAPPAPKPAGDVLTLKSGKVLRGLQVRRSTPQSYEIELGDGSIVLHIPRRQVVSVEFDDFDPRREALMKKLEAARPPAPPKPSAALLQKLDMDVATPPLKFNNADLLEILAELGKRAEVEIVPAEAVSAMPKEKRQWTLTPPKGTTLRAILEEKLPGVFKGLNVVYEGDRILVAPKPPAGSGAAPAGGTPPAPPKGEGASESKQKDGPPPAGGEQKPPAPETQ